jgi:hypothetical protein
VSHWICVVNFSAISVILLVKYGEDDDSMLFIMTLVIIAAFIICSYPIAKLTIQSIFTKKNENQTIATEGYIDPLAHQPIDYAPGHDDDYENRQKVDEFSFKQKSVFSPATRTVNANVYEPLPVSVLVASYETVSSRKDENSS